MLKQRIMTALILIPAVVGLIYLLPTFIVALVFAAIVLLGGREWSKMVPCTTAKSQKLFLLAISVLLLVGYFISFSSTLVLIICMFAVAWWSFVLLWLWQVRTSGHEAAQSVGRVTGLAQCLVGSPRNKAVIGLATLLPCFIAITYLHTSAEYGAHYVFYCMSLMWAADSGAYFAGKKWGNRKLAPGVSPGKTIEGVTGGCVAAAIWTILWMFFAGLGESSPLLFFVIAMITTLYSVGGDLFESLFKRIAQIKDSGQLLPGHGGVLDRIDSLTAGAPVFVLGLMLL